MLLHLAWAQRLHSRRQQDLSSWLLRLSSVQPPVQASLQAARAARPPLPPPAATRPSKINSIGKHPTHKYWSNNRIGSTIKSNLWEVLNLWEVSSNNRIKPTIEWNLCGGFNRTCDDQHSNQTCGRQSEASPVQAQVVQSELVLTA